MRRLSIQVTNPSRHTPPSAACLKPSFRNVARAAALCGRLDFHVRDPLAEKLAESVAQQEQGQTAAPIGSRSTSSATSPAARPTRPCRGLHAAEHGGGDGRSAAARHEIEPRQVELADACMPPTRSAWGRRPSPRRSSAAAPAFAGGRSATRIRPVRAAAAPCDRLPR